MPVKVLFVCLGNICRSPAAESVMNCLIAKHKLEGRVVTDSAGTAGYHTGDFADPRMVEAGERRGYQFLSRARKVYPEQDFKEFDYILAADYANLAALKRQMIHPTELENRLFLMCDFCKNFKSKEVPDPYFGGADGFEHVLDLLEDACSGLLEHIKLHHKMS